MAYVTDDPLNQYAARMAAETPTTAPEYEVLFNRYRDLTALRDRTRGALLEALRDEIQSLGAEIDHLRVQLATVTGVEQPKGW